VQVEGSVSIVRRVGNGEVGPLALGFVPSASNNILPTILRAFPERYPEVELFLHEMKPDALVQRMHDRRIDVSFFYLPFHDAALMFRPVLREPLVAALPEAHPLAGGARGGPGRVPRGGGRGHRPGRGARGEGFAAAVGRPVGRRARPRKPPAGGRPS
jgi:DNA-binding transcriptional LysR family regulator